MKQKITREQLEIIKKQLEGRNDPVFFGEKFLGMNFYEQQKLWLWVTTKTKKEKAKELLIKLGICFSTPENLDDDLNKIYTKIDRHIFCVANQAGKTVLTAVKHIWSCYYKIGKHGDAEEMELDDYKTLNTSPHSDQANKCFEYVQRMCRGEMVWFDPITNKMKRNIPDQAMDNFIKSVNSIEKEVKFINGSTFWSKSSGPDKGTSRAGEQFGLITYDEASQSINMKTTIAPLLSRLLRYGYCFDIISTPEANKPSHGFYLSLVKKGIKLEEGWFALTNVSLDHNVFIEPNQKEKAKESIKLADPVQYHQMIHGKFISLGRKLFSVHAVANIFSDKLKQLQFGQPTRKYVMSADWAMADKGDKTWFIIIDYTDYLTNKLTIVHHEVLDGGEPQVQYAAARDLYNRFGGEGQVKFIMDISSMGGTIIKKELWDLKPIEFSYQGGKKDEMLMKLSMALNHQRKYEIGSEGDIIEKNPEFGKLRSYILPELETQLSNYHTDDKKLEQDAVMTLGQAVWWIDKLPKNLDMELDLNPLSRYNNIRNNRSRYY